MDLALAIQMASIAESMAYGANLGLEAKTLAAILNASSSRCWSSSNYNPVPVSLLQELASCRREANFLRDLYFAVQSQILSWAWYSLRECLFYVAYVRMQCLRQHKSALLLGFA